MPTTNLHHHHHHSPPKRHPKLLSFFLKFIVLSLILALFLIFLGLAAIILLHVLFAGSFLHRRRRNTTTPPPTTSAYSLQDLQTHLPSFQYSSDSLTESCSICLDSFKERVSCRSLPECHHVFHAKCVDSWLTKVPSCPVCRRRVQLEVDRPADRSESDDDDCKFLWVIRVGERIGVNY